MQDIIGSLNTALHKQGWLFGQKFHRIGNPFVWVDTEQVGSYKKQEMLRGVTAVLQYLALFSEEYPIPEEIRSEDYMEMTIYIEDVLRKAFAHFAPFLNPKESGFEQYIRSTAIVRAQDYSAIQSMTTDLKKGLCHLDIGPGLGSHAIYSLKGFNSTFYGLEAYPMSYAIQRDFFRFLSSGADTYLDLVECENLFVNERTIKDLVSSPGKFKIKHIPSWFFGTVPDSSIDLITATWVLNEVTTAGLLWLLSHSSRVLKKGGYLYIRDSGLLKPSRHAIKYDELLQKLGFVRHSSINVRNRVDFYGIPRVYKNTRGDVFSFDQLVDMCIGHLSIPAWGGDFPDKQKV